MRKNLWPGELKMSNLSCQTSQSLWKSLPFLDPAATEGGNTGGAGQGMAWKKAGELIAGKFGAKGDRDNKWKNFEDEDRGFGKWERRESLNSNVLR